jgi:hypothetical protein
MQAKRDEAQNDETKNDAATGFFQPILGDGRPLLLLIAGSLLFAGGFAIFLAATGEFLPHDIHYLGMSAADLCRIRSCRVVDFMVHDRSSFGGHVRRRGAVRVACRLPPGARRAVGVVGPVDQRRRRIRRFPHLPRIRLPRHLARRRRPAHAPRVRHRHGARSPLAGRHGRSPQHPPAWRPARLLQPLRLGTGPPPGSGSHRDRRPQHHVGGHHRHLRPRGPGVHGDLGTGARSHRSPPRSPAGARPGRLRRRGLDHGPDHAPLPLVRPACTPPQPGRRGSGRRVLDGRPRRPRGGGLHRPRSSRPRAGRSADAGGGAGIGLAGNTGLERGRQVVRQ